jgi:release factor glutamine methyltransferase
VPKTYNDVYLESRKKLKASGIKEYSLEARIILSAAAHKTKEEFIRDAQLYVGNEYQEKVDKLIARRLSGEPVAYITGDWEFYGVPLTITKEVLIPRIDTEVLVDTAVECLKGRNDIRVLDLCAGSGCIGIAIAKELGSVRVVLVDNSDEALKVCRLNVLQSHLTQRVTCIRADIKETPPMLIGSFDMIICNPPYIPTADIENLDPEVRDYEPTEALDGGPDGLDFYRYLAANWHRALKPGGLVAVECGMGQAQDVKNIMTQKGFVYYKTVKDTQGIDRVVVSKQV